MLMGLLSLVIGIVIGSLLSKGFLKLLVNMLELHVNVHFEVPIGAIIDTAIIFVSLFYIHHLKDTALFISLS